MAGKGLASFFLFRENNYDMPVFAIKLLPPMISSNGTDLQEEAQEEQGEEHAKREERGGGGNVRRWWSWVR